MTREEYFTILKDNIQSLSLEEQNEALQYYSDYFDDAGDDEKTMEELGAPEKVAEEIRDKFSNALVAEKKEEEHSSGQNSSGTNNYEALYFEFDSSIVKNLDFGFGAAEIVFVTGTNKFTVETRGITKEFFECRLDSNGTFIAKNSKSLKQFRFWDHSRGSRMVPRILVTIPQNANVNYMKIALGAGKLTTKGISLSYNRGKFEVGAGNLVLDSFNGHETEIRCGMGNLELKGKFLGRTNIDCGMGAVSMTLFQSEAECSYDAKVGLGSFVFNDFRKSGVSQINNGRGKENHFSVNVGMGSVSIRTK